MRILYAILILVLLFSSCKKETFAPDSDFGYNYQPSTLGHWVEYAVDSTIYNDITSPPTITTSSYFIREEIDTTYIDASGVSNVIIAQYRKNNINDAWNLIQAGSFKLSDDNFQRYFNDLRFMNLIFPVREGREWPGHSFLDVQDEPTLEYLDDTKYDWNFTYTDVDESLSIDSLNIDSTLTVIQIDDENLFEKKFSKEQYARNIGLISKELLILNTQAPPSGASFIDRAESGFIVNWRIIDYKN